MQVMSDWKHLARKMGAREEELQEVEADSSGMRDRCFRSLMLWKEKKGSDATFDVLIKHLKRCKYYHAAGESTCTCTHS